MMKISKIENKINRIKKKIKNLKNIIKYYKEEKKLNSIKKELKKENIWKNNKLIIELKKKKKKIENKINPIKKNITKIKYLIELIKLSKKLKSYEILKDINKEIKNIEKKTKKIEFYKMFYNKYDNLNCYLDLQSGSGGIESQDWANMLLKMYLKWAQKKKFKTKIISESKGEIAGIKSSTIHISGHFAFGWFRTETGIHRLVRKSPFNSTGKRHTSFASIYVYPEIKKKIKSKISYSDIKIDVYRSSGAGGQHVNKTESAVRITHIPTNLVTQCQNYRSQHKNKEQAIKQMEYKLYNLEIKKNNKKKKKIEDNKSKITWSKQIRSYILDMSKIKDIRTGIESNDIESILNGNLDKFIKETLKLGI
ncbi:peptide chain release factor 2 [Buchnera aphidicola (Ceratovacuna keduensis)]|uniref:peptide chain release factor 2 n=1 Tax=Buchnera aphidicola TaxID=9 RepID=UPI0031B860AA